MTELEKAMETNHYVRITGNNYVSRVFDTKIMKRETKYSFDFKDVCYGDIIIENDDTIAVCIQKYGYTEFWGLRSKDAYKIECAIKEILKSDEVKTKIYFEKN